MSGRVRDQLAGGPHYDRKKAWRELIRALRERKRAGDPVRIRGQGDLARALDAEREVDAEAVHAALASLVRTDGEDRLVLAGVLDALIGVEDAGSVTVRVTGWPPGFSERARLLRLDSWSDELELPASRAAALAREFNGFVLGGGRLRVEASAELPPVPRALRARPMRRGRVGPWLECDPAGARFLTPRELADRIARRVTTPRVVDAFAGCGGNSVAFAEAGLDVVAIEADPDRAAVLRRNLGGRGRVIVGRAEAEAPRLLGAGTTLFVDPPWEVVPRQDGPRWADLVPWPELLGPWPILAKLPREFDVASLPGEWSVHWEFGERDDDRAVVRMISAQRSP